MLVLFDPNLLISALITPRGIARHVVLLGIEGGFEYVICPNPAA